MDMAEQMIIARQEKELPPWAGREELARFFHETMQPWNDSLEDVNKALDYCFAEEAGKGGFLTILGVDERLVGAVLMLETGMEGYVPEHILLMVTIDPSQRGKGLGKRLIERAIEECPGDVKLHVEYDNPAKRLYERIGFTSKYAEMRLKRS
jgi:GNAT superfamily N-acetyltransferase